MYSVHLVDHYVDIKISWQTQRMNLVTHDGEMAGVSLTASFGGVLGIALAFSVHTSLGSCPCGVPGEAITQTQMQGRSQDSVLCVPNPPFVWDLQLWPQWGLCTQLSLP